MIERIDRYVAIGDSFTEGLWDTSPRSGGQRGWADRLAETLSQRRREGGLAPLEYANHAIRGKLLEPIVTEQLPLALAQEPTLISIVGGGNDILRPGVNPDALAKTLERAVVAARQAGAMVLVGTGIDPAGLPLVQRTRPKVATYNAHVWSIARNHGAAVLDLWGMRVLKHPGMWAKDKIHLSPTGHHRVAQAALVALGLEPADPQWRTPLSPHSGGAFTSLREQGDWFATEVAPWLARRLRGRSSGDDRVAKLPKLRPVIGDREPG